MTPTKILVVEDEFITAADIATNLRQSGYEVVGSADNGEDAIKKAGDLHPDLILMDITLNGEMTGIEAADKVKVLYDIPVVFLTAHFDDMTVEKAKTPEPFGYVIKPYNIRDLKITIELALYMHKIRKQILEREYTIRVLLNTVPDSLLMLDPEGRIITMNDTMAGAMHTDPATATTGKHYQDIFGELPCKSLTGAVDTVLRTGEEVNFEEQRGRNWYETRVYPVSLNTNEISRIVIQCQDITRQKEIERQLRTTGLHQIEHDMEQFQILNDQIRNPLQVILLYLELDKPAHRDEIKKLVASIDTLVSQLDKGWLESEKVRNVLMKHYQYTV